MKKIYALAGMLVVVCFLFTGCDRPDYGPVYVRVKSFTWDGTLYNAQYDKRGKLLTLKATNRAIEFSYDEDGKLYKTVVNNTGEPIPLYLYEFDHGTFGIKEIRRYARGLDDGQLHIEYIQKVNYASATKLSSLLQQEVAEEGDSIVIHFQQDRKFIYTGNNVYRIIVEPPWNEYAALSYDDKVNPFMMMASSVGNPAFFPIGRYVNFPVVDFNIPLVAVFSKNNPLTAWYGFTLTPPSTYNQTFTYTYGTGGLATTALWTAGDTRTFKFEYEKARRW